MTTRKMSHARNSKPTTKPMTRDLQKLKGNFLVSDPSFKPGLHIVGRIATMCLRPCPKEYIRDLKHDDAFKPTWPPVLSVDKCCQVTSLSIERTAHHVC